MNMDERELIEAFAERQLELLQREFEAELAETAALVSKSAPTVLQRAGLAITNLTIDAQRTGLGGKHLVDLCADPATADEKGLLPDHGLRTGDIVLVSEQPVGSAKKRELRDLEAKGCRGVVVRVSERVVSVALEREDDETLATLKRLWLVKVANDATHKRLKQTMERLRSMDARSQTSLLRLMLGLDTPTPASIGERDSVSWFLENLNESQKAAVQFAMDSKELALIWGPPGTGKTHTLIELILQLLARGQRILVCGPSNISVDNIVERLSSHKVSMVRLGHAARLLPSVLNYCLDIQVQSSDAASIARDIRTEMNTKQASIRKTRSGKERKVIYGELRELRKELRARDDKCVLEVTSTSKVVLSTLHGAGGYQLRDQLFDCVIIDEASQALEAQCWIPLLRAKKAVLAGDHLQLPPTIKSSNTATPTRAKESKGGISDVRLELTLFERMVQKYPASKRMLNVQYRMHETIMQFPSQELYDSKLIAAKGTMRLLTGLPYGVEDTENTSEPVVFYDTQGGEFSERDGSDGGHDSLSKARTWAGESKSNELEVLLVKKHLSNLVEAGVRNDDIAIVSPYNAQVALLNQALKALFPGVEIGSVDGFQGREKEAIIVSLVRSNAKGEVGFLSEKRRLNAMTRPRRHLAIIADSETLSQGSGFLKRWMLFLENNSDLRYPTAASLYDP